MVNKTYLVIGIAVIVLGGGLGGWWYWSTYLSHTMVILHPHSSEFADMVIDDFVAWVSETKGYTITVAQKQQESGACYDQVTTWNGVPEAEIWWGGGTYYFDSATRKGLLYPYTTANDAAIPEDLFGWPLKGPNNEWYAAALSSFGFMWNVEALDANNLDEPITWNDLVDPQYRGHIVMCDPAASGSTTASLLMGLQAMAGTDPTAYAAAWGYYAMLAGNVGLFTTSSHDVPVRVVTGEYPIGIVIDYYYTEEKIAGEDVEFSLGDDTTVSPDPAAILDGATNLEDAKLFMDYITSVRGQTKVGTIRSPVHPDAIPTSPVMDLYDPGTPLIVFDKTINDEAFSAHRKMFSSWLVDNHVLVKDAWSKILQCIEEGKMGTNFDNAVLAFATPPMGYATADELKAHESAHYGPDAVPWAYGYWGDWGADKFQLAIDEATLELAT